VTRTFVHSFHPATARPEGGPTVDLTTQEIEDAGINEVLQDAPSAELGSDSALSRTTMQGLPSTGGMSPFGPGCRLSLKPG
jgi:hypothetical protein